MTFFDIFTKKRNDDTKYHATAKVLINMGCDVNESKGFARNLNLTEDGFSEFHRHKRDLACKTVLYTAVISMELKKRNKFVKIFIERQKIHDDLNNAPPDVREMILKMNNITDAAYQEAFSQVTNSLQNTPNPHGVPVDKLMESFCWLFCSFLGKKDDRAYFEIGRHIFNRHHKNALNALNNL